METGAMKMLRTYFQDHVCRTKCGTDKRTTSHQSSGVPRKIYEKSGPPLHFLSLGLIGLLVLAYAMTPCPAAARQANNTSSQTNPTLRGIRDPLNPQGYMQELAGRLSSEKGKDTFMRGVETTPSTAAPRPAQPTQPMGMQSPTGQRPIQRDVDLQKLIAEELERQEREEQQQRLREQELRRLVAAEVSKIRQASAQHQVREPNIATTRPDYPGPQAQVMTEQDLRNLIAQELHRQGLTATQPAAAEPETKETEETDLQARIARELERQRTEAQPVVPQPERTVTPIPQAVEREPAEEEPDLQTLIARELERRRQRQAQPPVPQPDTRPTETQQTHAQASTMSEQELRALIAREVDRQQAAPSTPPEAAQEPDLQTLIAEELARRRQRAQETSEPRRDPFLADARPTTSGVSPVTGLAPDNRAAYRAYRDIQAQRGLDEPWSLGTDLERYRTYAVSRGSRSTVESLKKALEGIGLALEDGANVLTLSYASDRGEPFRANDGKGFFQEPGNVPRQLGRTLVDFGDGVYSLVDLALLNALADKDKAPYRDNHPVVRPLVYTGKTITGLWRTTEEIGNALTWGYFDNLTGPMGMLFEDIIEVLKHSGQAVTNLARTPVHLLGGEDSGVDKALDWVLLVPLEMAGNIITMQGFANMDNYETAFAEKGVIGSILEFGGSSYILYRAVKELHDELTSDNGTEPSPSESGNNGQLPTETPTDPSTQLPPPESPSTPSVPVEPTGDVIFYWPLS